MPSALHSIDSSLAQSLRTKSDSELIGILADPADWRPDVVEFARVELEHRSMSGAQVDEKVGEITQRKNEEFQQRGGVPLTSRESIWAFLLGFVFGLLGLLFVWPRAARFEKHSYALKAQKTWRLCWFGIGARFAAVVALAMVVSVMR
jgi:hypothetical protein